MSLPKRLYDTYRSIQNCALLKNNDVSESALKEFENLLNESQPNTEDEQKYQFVVRGMYHSNPVGFTKYVSGPRNNVGALILWTESKRIVAYFNLKRRIHISWDKETKLYVVTLHKNMLSADSDNTESKEEPQRVITRREKYITRHKQNQERQTGKKSKYPANLTLDKKDRKKKYNKAERLAQKALRKQEKLARKAARLQANHLQGSSSQTTDQVVDNATNNATDNVTDNTVSSVDNATNPAPSWADVVDSN